MYWKIFIFVLLAMMMSIIGFSQDDSHAGPGMMMRMHHGPGLHGDMLFIASEMGFGKEVVKGAPYSAQATTERVQTLADGSRINQKSNATIYRDSQGRVRREQEFGSMGPFSAAEAHKHSRHIFINDPVAKAHYILDPDSQTAHKMNFPDFSKFSKPQQKGVSHPTPAEGSDENFTSDVEGDKKTESLRETVIEGVRASGTKTTVTIPAGQIGNEHPLQIVTEKWYSPELQINISVRHSDPRFGETVYTLTNILRKEPDASLFQIPSDYKVVDAPFHGPIKMETPNE